MPKLTGLKRHAFRWRFGPWRWLPWRRVMFEEGDDYHRGATWVFAGWLCFQVRWFRLQLNQAIARLDNSETYDTLKATIEGHRGQRDGKSASPTR
jgi:hypothetical protein